MVNDVLNVNSQTKLSLITLECPTQLDKRVFDDMMVVSLDQTNLLVMT